MRVGIAGDKRKEKIIQESGVRIKRRIRKTEARSQNEEKNKE